MDQSITNLLHAAGLDRWVPLVLAILALARALEVLLPQPAAGSHWLPLRKLLSMAAWSVGNAAPDGQPPLVTWLQRVAKAILTAVPPPAPAAPVAPPVAPPSAPVAPPANPAPAVPAMKL